MKRFPVAATGLVACLLALAADAAEPPRYRNVLDGSPIGVPTDGADLTEAVRAFHQSGNNPYLGDDAALEEGGELYDTMCAACHMPDGSGRIGPSLIDGKWNYDYTATPQGRFAIVYAGGAGAMQAFSDRLTQDQILRVLAYIRTLDKRAE